MTRMQLFVDAIALFEDAIAPPPLQPQAARRAITLLETEALTARPAQVLWARDTGIAGVGEAAKPDLDVHGCQDMSPESISGSVQTPLHTMSVFDQYYEQPCSQSFCLSRAGTATNVCVSLYSHL